MENIDWNNKNVVLEVVKQNGLALQFASEKLQDDKNVVLEAIKQDGGALRFAPEELRDDKKVVLEAVKQDGRALRFASEKLCNDKDIQIAAGIIEPSIDDIIADAKKWCAEHNTPSSDKMELER